MNIYISTHLWQFNLYLDHIYGKNHKLLAYMINTGRREAWNGSPWFFFHMAASLPIHPRWGYVALGSNVGDRCECPKIGSTPGGFDRFDLHIGILTIDLNIKHGKITISIGVLFDVERFLREYLLYTWYSSYGSMIVPPQPSGWYPPRSFFEHIWGGSSGVSPPLASWPLSSIKQIKQHGEAPDSQTSHVFLGWNALNPSRSTKSSRFFMIFLFVASKKPQVAAPEPLHQVFGALGRRWAAENVGASMGPPFELAFSCQKKAEFYGLWWM